MQPDFWRSGFYLVASGLVVCLYHVYFMYQFHVNPRNVSLGMANYCRANWVKAVMNRRDGILAVQTMRNWIMSASFLASTAVLLSLGLLSIGHQLPEKIELIRGLKVIEVSTDMHWQAKWLILAGDLFFAFFNFTLTIRQYNHASFLITVTPEENDSANSELVIRTINRGALHNMLGMRAYYFTVPLVMWLFGPQSLLIGCLFLIVALSVLDHNL